MKVLFLEHVLHVAKKGEIKEVSSWYATNFLFPKKLAQMYTPELEQKLKREVQKKESDRRVILGKKGEITHEFEGQIFLFELPWKDGHIFGSVTPKDVAELISKKYHYPLTKKHIDFGPHHSNFKSQGIHEIYIDMGKNYAVKAKVEIKIAG